MGGFMNSLTEVFIKVLDMSMAATWMMLAVALLRALLKKPSLAYLPYVGADRRAAALPALIQEHFQPCAKLQPDRSGDCKGRRER